ncbi:MAG: prolipoprotein diacylglyceryl transferase [Acidobacteriota bacterium]
MYPVLFRFGSFEITSFGVMVGLGALVGLWLFRRELAAGHLPPAAADGAVVGVVAGLIGAKLLWTVEHAGEAPLSDLLLSRGGLSWFGGFIGGVGTALVWFAWRRYPILPILAASTPALAAGHAIGRIGCFLVGDDYGRPTSLPWGVAFPQGLPPTYVPVHPTQLYEAAFLVPLTWLLIRWRRQGLADRSVLGWYLLLTGIARFAIEVLRVNVRVAFGLTVAQFAAAAIVVAGGVLILSGRQTTVHR